MILLPLFGLGKEGNISSHNRNIFDKNIHSHSDEEDGKHCHITSSDFRFQRVRLYVKKCTSIEEIMLVLWILGCIDKIEPLGEGETRFTMPTDGSVAFISIDEIKAAYDNDEPFIF